MSNREHTSKLCTRTGGFAGLVAFFLYGLKVAFVYGGMIGVITASAMSGGPVGAELSTRVLVAGGMLMGVLAVGSIMVVLGAIFGTAFDAFVLAPIARYAHTAAPAKLTPVAVEAEAPRHE